MPTPLTNTLDRRANQLSQDEQNVTNAYNTNMAADDMSMLDMRSLQMFSSLLSVKALVETNFIKLQFDILKNIARNVVP